jgi:hypothetical protein
MGCQAEPPPTRFAHQETAEDERLGSKADATGGDRQQIREPSKWLKLEECLQISFSVVVLKCG